MASSLTASARYTSAMPPEQLLAALSNAVEPLDGGFKLMSKLSGGGIVVRTFRTPETDLDWFGIFTDDRFSIALIPRDKTATPYQPILRGHITAQGRGSALELTLKPHPDARIFSIFFTFGGALLAAASLLAITKAPAIAATGLAFAALFLAFPGLRARISFKHACDVSLTAFEERFALKRLPEDDAPA